MTKEVDITAYSRTDPEKMNVRDYITVGVIFILIIVVYSAIGLPLGITAMGSIFIWAICAIPWGILYMLLFVRVNKKYVVLTIGSVISALMLITFIPSVVVIWGGVLIAHIYWTRNDRKKFTTMAVSFAIMTTFWYLGTPTALLFFFDDFVAKYPAYASLYTEIYELILGPMVVVVGVATFVASIAGAYLGKIVLRKHFEKAGIV